MTQAIHATLSLLVLLLACCSSLAQLQVPSTDAARANNDSLLWGTYRPNLYFGMRPRLPESLLSGLIWYGADTYESFRDIRHACREEDRLQSYEWQQHDGRTYARQLLKDTPNNVDITTELIKIPGGVNGGSWTVRIKGSAEPHVKTSLLYYFGLEGKGHLNLDNKVTDSGVKGDVELSGKTPELGEYKIKFETGLHEAPVALRHQDAYAKSLENWQALGLFIPDGQQWRAREFVESDIGAQLQAAVQRWGPDNGPDPALLYTLSNSVKDNANFYAFQKVFEGPFDITISYASLSAGEEIDTSSLDTLSKTAMALFNDRFEQTFHLVMKGYSQNETLFAQALLSSIVGSHGYFYGQSIVDRSWVNEYDEEELDFWEDSHRRTPEPRLTFPTALFTVVPCRPFFPRGFLWDEGFHQLIVGKWDNDLSLDVIRHWISLIDEDGWVAREQILGEEARSKVPPQFQTQYPHYANPPTLMMAITAFIDRLESANTISIDDPHQMPFDVHPSMDAVASLHLSDPNSARAYLKTIYPKLRSNYLWYRRTQRGEIKAYGRRARNSREAYRWRGRSPDHTLTSGLDDYPRSRPPHPGELHLDLISWIGFMTNTLSRVAATLDEEDDLEEWIDYYEAIKGNIIDLHWNDEAKMFCDVGIDEFDESAHVCHKGYLSLFPMMLGLLDADSEYLKHTLDIVEDPEELWSEFGIRSLSKSDEFFGQGEDYWRGPIWINVNYMILSSLHRYSQQAGPHRSQAASIYKRLRENIVKNVFKVGFRERKHGANIRNGRGPGMHGSSIIRMMDMVKEGECFRRLYLDC